MFIKLLILSLLLVALSGIFLGIRILLRQNGKFPQFHVGHNKEMRKRGISCAQRLIRDVLRFTDPVPVQPAGV
jgi:hypothetical protein